METTVKTQKKSSPLKSCSNAIVNGLEHCFYRLGCFIGKHPWITIILSFVLLLIFVPGIPLFFYEENRSDRLWVADTAQALTDKRWVEEEFPLLYRFNSLILKDTNVLTPTILRAMLDIDQEIKMINKTDTYDWNSICVKLGASCWASSLLELWLYNETVINSLTQSDILNMVNSVSTSPMFGTDFNVSNVLGKISRDGSGNIIGAQAALMTYVIEFNVTIKGGNEIDELADDWEKKFLVIGESGHADIDTVYRFAFRSFGDIGGGAIQGDSILLTAGYLIIIIFVSIVLGRFNSVQQRVYLTLAGVLSVGMAIALSFGLCSYAGLFYGPLHSILPFLLIGLGVDDMFVIVGAWENLGSEIHKSRPLHERVGLCLRDAGVSITVTSLTDVLAFGIGASTILPALKSFCIYCCISILADFFFQATFFVACLTINEMRAEKSRDACCCCYTHTDWQPNDCSKKLFVKTFFEDYLSPFLLKLPVKVMTVILAVGLAAGGIYGTVQLEQDFDPVWFFPGGTYPKEYFQASDLYFPDDGINSNVYMGELDYYGSFSDLLVVYDEVSAQQYTLSGSVRCWYCDYKTWLNTTTNPAVTSLLNADDFPSSEANFYSLVRTYLYSGGGSRYISDIKFKTGSDVIKASRMPFSHSELAGGVEEIEAMDGIREAVSRAGFPSSQCFPYSQDYFNIETTKVIGEELYRNLGLAFLCVFLMTLLLIANLWTCLLVALCVIMTLVDVLGMTYFWGLTIDTVTSIMIIVAIGLAVDYSAHIGHTFMVETGTRNERTRKTLANIGPAVFYGGLSTFLAFILLANSDSYVFSTFFRVFFGVVLFGLFHGLVVLPVLLSWLGPDPYDLTSHEDAQTHPEQVKQQPGQENGMTSEKHNQENGHKNGYSNPALEESNMSVMPNQVSPLRC